MFEWIGLWEHALPASAAAVTVAAVWILARYLSRTLSIEARDARKKRLQLDRLADTAGLRVAESSDRLEGRVGGWPVEVRRTWAPIQRGGVPSEHWSIRLHADCPPSSPARPLPLPPPGLAPLRRSETDLVATLPIGPPSQLTDQLAWMASTAARLHTMPQAGSGPEAPLHTACRRLGLVPDAALPRWTGRWHGRSLLVEHLGDRPFVMVHLALQVALPPGLWLGSRDDLDASGDPVPLPLHPAASPLAATAAPEGVDAARDLLHAPRLLHQLAPHFSDGRGSRIYGGVVSLARPTMVFSVAPEQVVEAAEGVAEALEAAVEQPWRALAAAHGLRVEDARAGGLPILSGDSGDFALQVRRVENEPGVELRAEPRNIRLVDGFRITRGRGGGQPTGNPIFDQYLSVTADTPLSPEQRAGLPVDALLPLFLGESTCVVSAAGVRVFLAGHPATPELHAALVDLCRLLPQLPQQVPDAPAPATSSE